jgi:hypothetical protein
MKASIMKANNHYLYRCQPHNVLLLTSVLACAVVLAPATLMGQQSDGGDGVFSTAQKSSKETELDVHKMIDALESHNPVPVMTKTEGQADRSWGTPVFDKKYDWAEYKRVDAAIDSLVSNAEAAWPEIIKHFDDKRYCITYHNDYGYNLSIGNICQSIVINCLRKAYYKHITLLLDMVHDPEYVAKRIRSPRIFREENGLKNWCEVRKNKKLYEMQIEMCEWVIGTVTALKNVSAEEREPFVKAVRAEIAELRTSKKAIRFAGFHGEEFGRYRPGHADVQMP